MATPDMTAGAGDVEKAQKEQAESLRKLTKQQNRLYELNQKKIERMERQAATSRVSAAEPSMSVEEAVALSGLGENANIFHKNTAAGFASKPPTSESPGAIEKGTSEGKQKEHNTLLEEATDKVSNFSKSLLFGAVSVTSFISAMNEVFGKQAEASKTVNDITIQRGQAMEGLRYSPAEQKAREARAATGKIPGNLTPSQEAQLLAAADQARRGVPGNEAMRNQVDELIYNPNIPFQTKLSAIQQSPQAANIIGTMGGRGRGRVSTSGALQTEADLARTKFQGEALGAEAGAANRQFEAGIEAQKAAGTPLGTAASFPLITPILKTLHEIFSPLNSQENRKATYDAHKQALKDTAPPPSTNAGR